jgi:hypothetical protein
MFARHKRRLYVSLHKVLCFEAIEMGLKHSYIRILCVEWKYCRLIFYEILFALKKYNFLKKKTLTKFGLCLKFSDYFQFEHCSLLFLLDSAIICLDCIQINYR